MERRLVTEGSSAEYRSSSRQGASVRQIERDAAGHHIIHQITRAESDGIRTQQIFFQAREMCESKGETRIVA